MDPLTQRSLLASQRSAFMAAAQPVPARGDRLPARAVDDVAGGEDALNGGARGQRALN
jgi:hypothetical protein